MAGPPGRSGWRASRDRPQAPGVSAPAARLGVLEVGLAHAQQPLRHPRPPAGRASLLAALHHLPQPLLDPPPVLVPPRQVGGAEVCAAVAATGRAGRAGRKRRRQRARLGLLRPEVRLGSAQRLVEPLVDPAVRASVRTCVAARPGEGERSRAEEEGQGL